MTHQRRIAKYCEKRFCLGEKTERKKNEKIISKCTVVINFRAFEHNRIDWI